ncbi:MAG: stage II sporulation protein R [Bacilli bacterium]|nr:stage II sporulation protein R [Bacilli bacterium]
MKKILLVLSIISLLYIGLNFKEEENIIPDEAIRFRVIANSNTVYDQNIKIQVRNTIQNEIFSLIKDSKSIEDTRKILYEHQKELYNITRNKLKELNYNKSFDLKYGYNHFP